MNHRRDTCPVWDTVRASNAFSNGFYVLVKNYLSLVTTDIFAIPTFCLNRYNVHLAHR